MTVQTAELLLERAGPLATVDELIAGALRGAGAALVVEAAAGLGKTALLAAGRASAASQGFTVARARGAELERGFPFGIARQLLEPIVAEATATQRQALFDGAAALSAPVFAGPSSEVDRWPSSVGGLSEAAGAAIHGLYWLVANVAERVPLLLCVDDAHWGDVASLRWLDYLTKRLEGMPVAMFLATRPREPDAEAELISAIAAEPITHLETLDALTEKGSSLLVRRVLGVEAHEEFCTACHELSAGNPFLLGELTGALAREGIVPAAASVPQLREFVPESVARSLGLRIARLPESARALARSVAVLGAGASLHDAAALAEMDDPEAARAVALLGDVAILAPGLPLEFEHPLVREAIYADLSAAERTVWHARAARVLAAGGASDERIAAQLMRAEPVGDTWVAARLRAAANDAMARGDSRAAHHFLMRALDEPPATADRGTYVRESAKAAFLVGGDGDEYDPSFTAEVMEADSETLRSSAVYLLSGLWAHRRIDEARALHARALAAATAAEDFDLALRLEVWWILIGQLLPADARRRLEPYGALIEPESLGAALLNATLAWCGSLTGESVSEVLDRLRGALASERLTSFLIDEPPLFSIYVFTLLTTDELALGKSIIEQYLAEGRARGAAPAVASALYLSAYLDHLRGDLVSAEANARASAAATDSSYPLPLLAALLVRVLADRGELDVAEAELDGAGLGGPLPESFWFGAVLASRGYLRLAQGRLDDGLEDLLELGRRWDRDGMGARVTWPWTSDAAPVLAQQGRLDEARDLAQRGLDAAIGWGTPRVIGQAQRGLGLVTGGAAGVETLREAVRTLESSPARLEHARALIDLGARLRRHNHRREARGPLEQGLELAHRCGGRLLADRAIQELRATGARPRRVVLTGVDALTASERRIAEMATEGLTNREIAQALFITVKTVETHMAHAFQKLDISSRNELGSVLGIAVGQRAGR